MTAGTQSQEEGAEHWVLGFQFAEKVIICITTRKDVEDKASSPLGQLSASPSIRSSSKRVSPYLTAAAPVQE